MYCESSRRRPFEQLTLHERFSLFSTFDTMQRYYGLSATNTEYCVGTLLGKHRWEDAGSIGNVSAWAYHKSSISQMKLMMPVS